MKRLDPPDIDSRDTADVIRQTSTLARKLSGWSPPEDEADAGTALIGAFATMAQQVITRLNQMPNRHFLAYLRMLGLQPRPPRAAEVPLTFTPSAGAQQVRVPAGTQVRGQHHDGTSATFYTSDALELLPSRKQGLLRAITYQPDIDYISVDTAKATGREAGYYSLFTGSDFVEHAIYLAADDVLTIADATIELSIVFSSEDDAESWQELQEISGTEPRPFVLLEYFHDDGVQTGWKPLDPAPGSVTEGSDGSGNYCFQFDRPADMASCALPIASEATRACWIRARLTAWPSDAIPAWCDVTLSTAESVEIPDTAPDQIQFNGVPIDTSKDYYPLGQQPAFNDCCTLVYCALPSASDATVTLHVAVSEANADLQTNDDPTLAWEIGNGDTWTAIDPEFGADDVAILKASGTATFSLPAAAAGTDSPALRVRLASGDYGKGIFVVASDGTRDGTRVVDNGYRPPILTSITARASYTPSATPVCVTDNGEGRQLEDFEQPLVPFQLRDDQEPAFYLAFGESLGQASVSMYLEVGPLSLKGVTRSELQALQGGGEPAEVQWEYYSATFADWQLLEVIDGTHGFAQGGFLRFVAPADHARSAQFGSAPLYWLRVRLVSGGYKVPPRAGRVLLNSVAASNARTIRDEVLGSSHQTPGQTFVLAHTPVLADPELVVCEPTPPSDDESAQPGVEFDPLAVAPASARSWVDDAGGTETAADLGAAWVRWKQVGSFAASGPQDRHYTLDHENGTVTFGDGRNGMAPPAGKNNVVMACYRSGGGAAGNLPAGAIDQLVTAVAHVATVDNFIASSGGADGEDSDAVMDWGPRVLRHRGRATARQDYEDLARQGFPQLAKVSAITPSFDPTEGAGSTRGAGHVLLAVVPDDDSDRPAPSLGLLQQIGDYLRARMPPAVQLSLSGPDWLVVNVDVTVIAKRMDRTGALEDEVGQALRRFLNPLSGGFDRTGWALGQIVHDSDLIRYLVAQPGIDSVSKLDVTRAPMVHRAGHDDMLEKTADKRLTVLLVCSGDHRVKALSPGSA
ncbi:putative baseplate assembly protein [Luteimonas salinilitoris]|uniref:Baseplate assembly protein n=1 Tax=Luteimonas salinilitoris TaxID=3237697 RepID=A0ABV4HPT0_9GAMM